MSFSGHVDISSDSDVEDYSKGMPPCIEVPDAKEKPLKDKLLKRAQRYQEYMSKVAIPNVRGSVIPFNSWTDLASSVKCLYDQPLHYLTNIHLKEWDQMRFGTEDENTPLDMLIHPSKAEITIWLLEEVHRGTTSPDHLAKLWLIDPWYQTYIDQMSKNLTSWCNSMNDDLESVSHPSKKKNHLSVDAKLHIFERLILMFNGKKLEHGSIKMLAQAYSVSTKTVSKIWCKARSFIANGDKVDLSNNLAKRVGRKRIEIDPEKVKLIPLQHRKSIASLAISLGMPKSVLHRRIKEGALRRHSNTIKPQLTEENKIARLHFCLSMLEVRSLSNNITLSVAFLEMHNRVVIAEKWFDMSEESEEYYLLPDENEPYSTCNSKKCIPNVMFLAAVARPWFDKSGMLFDGKIGIFPFICQEPAKRNDENGAAGTLKTKPSLAITQDVIRSCLIEKVIPAIKEKWPCCSRNSTIYVQQNNARLFDDKFLEATQGDGFDIQLSCQPPNSPDLNVLDLEYFRDIQSFQYREDLTTIDELVAAVNISFEELSPSALNRAFLTFQECMIEVMKCKGGNDYKRPGRRKYDSEKESRLPATLSCDYGIVQEALTHIHS